jgi:hypothetical protein
VLHNGLPRASILSESGASPTHIGAGETPFIPPVKIVVAKLCHCFVPTMSSNMFV